jgi:hypothetical protein
MRDGRPGPGPTSDLNLFGLPSFFIVSMQNVFDDRREANIA